MFTLILWRRLNWLALIVPLVTAPGCHQGHQSTHASTNVEQFAIRLDSAPSWLSSTPDANGSTRMAGLDKLGRDFQKLPLEEARELVAIYHAKSFSETYYEDSAHSESKIYVLLRFYFNVPEEELLENAEFFGSWHGVPHKGNTVNLLWPLSTTNGTLQLTGTFGGYYGPPYNALGEFDFFNARYGRRVAQVARNLRPARGSALTAVMTNDCPLPAWIREN